MSDTIPPTPMMLREQAEDPRIAETIKRLERHVEILFEAMDAFEEAALEEVRSALLPIGTLVKVVSWPGNSFHDNTIWKITEQYLSSAERGQCYFFSYKLDVVVADQCTSSSHAASFNVERFEGKV